MTDAANQVEVDHAELARELDQIEIPPDSTPHSDVEGEAVAPAAAGSTASMPAPASWAELTPGVVAAVDLFVCPGWALTDREKSALADALAPALDQLFPGGIGDERWAPYFRVLVVAGGIVATRYDRDTGKLKPLRSTAKPAADDAAPTAAPPAGEGGGSFKLAAGQ